MLTQILLAITSYPLLNALIWIFVIGLIAYLLWWLVDFIGLPAPFSKIAKALIAIVAVIMLINFLLGILGNPF